ncbi:MAG: M48 family metalloprotease [Bilophila sp.]
MMAGSMAAGQAAMLNYSRMDETEAEAVRLQYLTAAGYRPQGLQGAFKKIRRKQWATGIDVPEYLSTHPDVGGRINEIHARIQGLSTAMRRRKDDYARFNRVGNADLGALQASPSPRPASSRSAREARRRTASPSWGRASSRNAATGSGRRTPPLPTRWPARPTTRWSCARPGVSTITRATPAPLQRFCAR